MSCSQVEGESEQYKRLRNRMVDQQIATRGIKDEHVLEAMRDVPRHQFVPEGRKGPHTEERFAFLLSLISFLLFILIVVGFYGAQELPFSPFQLVRQKRRYLCLAGYYVLFSCPFFLAGCFVGLNFIYYRERVGTFTFLPLVIGRGEHRPAALGKGKVFLYSSLLGLAFMFVEIGYIEKCILLLGHPIFALAWYSLP